MYISRWNVTCPDYNYVQNGSRTMRTPRDTNLRRKVIQSCGELGRKKAINLGGGGGGAEEGEEKDKKGNKRNSLGFRPQVRNRPPVFLCRKAYCRNRT
jgi:hypothetical protein